MVADTVIETRGRRKEKSAATRGTILMAAERVFAASGLAGARTDEIAARAGVNKALLYYYFHSKEGLYEAVLENHFRDFNRQAMEILEAPGSPRVILLQYVAMHFDFISARHRHASLYQQLMMSGGKLLERLVRTYFEPRSKALGKLLERGETEGEFRPTQHVHTAVSIVGLIVFYFSASHVLQLLGHSGAYSNKQLQIRKDEVLNFIRYALFLHPEAPLT